MGRPSAASSRHSPSSSWNPASCAAEPRTDGSLAPAAASSLPASAAVAASALSSKLSLSISKPVWSPCCMGMLRTDGSLAPTAASWLPASAATTASCPERLVTNGCLAPMAALLPASASVAASTLSSWPSPSASCRTPRASTDGRLCLLEASSFQASAVDAAGVLSRTSQRPRMASSQPCSSRSLVRRCAQAARTPGLAVSRRHRSPASSAAAAARASAEEAPGADSYSWQAERRCRSASARSPAVAAGTLGGTAREGCADGSSASAPCDGASWWA
mmetsp:Transcript_13112/g.37420  ORF Transcript_13112/g.37420 Transcript_13112/m.37420 type:complete len:276 (-) Transcript_13112:147-974(-)